jgi:phospholipid transport system substrate-binding protein
MSRQIASVACLLLLPLLPARAHAGDAGVELQRQADRVVAVLADRSRDPLARRHAVREIVDDAFDFEEASRRALGGEWAQRSAAERAHFVGLFVGLIDRAYLRRLDDWDGQRIVIGDETVDGDRATVRAAIVTRDGDQTPVDYLMRRCDDGRWRVVDIKLGGASLVSNYRAQFARLLQAGGFAHLLERLQAKVDSLQP